MASPCSSATPVTIQHRPRWYQGAMSSTRQRMAIALMHRRGGKTVWAIGELIADVAGCKLHRPQGAYLCPQQNQAKRVAWGYVKDLTGDVPGMQYNNSELLATFPHGGTIRLLGAENCDSLRGMYLDSVVLDELAQMEPRVWGEIIRPCLADREGRAICIGTPMGRLNTFHRLWKRAAGLPDWSQHVYTWRDTQVLPIEELRSMRREMSADEWRQEMECDFTAAIRGAYYAKQMEAAQAEGRITAVPYDDQLPVFTSWDLGINNPTVLVYWQSVGAELRCIRADAYESTGLAGIVKEMRGLDYASYSRHYLPHDVAVRELGTGVSRQEVLEQLLGMAVEVVPALDVEDGIEATKSMLGRTWFDEGNCEVLLEALRHYRSERDEKRDTLKMAPLHDWSSHWADAVRMLAVSDGNSGRLGQGNLDLRHITDELDRVAI